MAKDDAPKASSTADAVRAASIPSNGADAAVIGSLGTHDDASVFRVHLAKFMELTQAMAQIELCASQGNAVMQSWLLSPNARQEPASPKIKTADAADSRAKELLAQDPERINLSHRRWAKLVDCTESTMGNVLRRQFWVDAKARAGTASSSARAISFTDNLEAATGQYDESA